MKGDGVIMLYSFSCEIKVPIKVELSEYKMKMEFKNIIFPFFLKYPFNKLDFGGEMLFIFFRILFTTKTPKEVL